MSKLFDLNIKFFCNTFSVIYDNLYSIPMVLLQMHQNSHQNTQAFFAKFYTSNP